MDKNFLKKSSPDNPSSAPDNRNIKEMIERMEWMKRDLDEKFANLFAAGQARHVDVGKLFGNQIYLSSQQLQLIKDHERQITKKIDDILTPESCLKAAPKSKEKLTQERRSKTRGARKNWLPMH